MPLRELPIGTQILHGRYQIVEKIEEGGVGIVYQIEDHDKCKFALKSIAKKRITAEIRGNLGREVVIHLQLDHPNIIKLHEFTEDRRFFYLRMELAEQEFFNFLVDRGCLPEPEAAGYLEQMIKALEYLKEKGIIHRDLKLENLLLSQDNQIKLCDFGWAHQGEAGAENLCGTPEYVAPEVMLEKPYNYKVDIWALGIILYEMLLGSVPFKGETIEETLNLVSRGEIVFPKNPRISPEARDLILNILISNPEIRFDYQDIRQHIWLVLQLLSLRNSK